LEGSSGGAARPAAGRPAAAGQPRRISPENFERLQSGLQEALSGLSRAGKLEEIPLNISATAATVWLKGATPDGTLTFAVVGSDRSADLAWSAMSPEDQGLLARLAAQLDSDNGDHLGIAAVYTELLGNPQQAGEIFGRAGQSRARWEGLLQ